MIDIHTHILPFVDDGAKDFDESKAIITSLVNQGVKHIFLTPHYYRERGYVSLCEHNLHIFNQLKEQVKDLDVTLYLGNEIKYSLDIFQYIEEGRVQPLSRQNFLIEFSVDTSEYDIFEAVHNMTAKGYLPVIAHIERYQALKTLESIKQLRHLGAMVQVNVSALLGKYGGKTKKWILSLIKHHLVDFVATDSHRFHENEWSKAYRFVCKKFSQEMADKIFNHTGILPKD